MSFKSDPTGAPMTLNSRSPALTISTNTSSIKDSNQNIPTTTRTATMVTQKTNHVSNVLLYGIPIVSLHIEGQERLCLAQISNTLLKSYSYNEIHNRRVALGITCVQCTPVQLEILRRAGAMPVSSRRCGMITRREAERLCKSFLGDNTPPRLPDDFAFNVQHKCAWGCRGAFLPSRYNSSRAKCIKCTFCGMFFSPNKFIFHSHRINAADKYVQPDAANFNSWRRHMFLSGTPPEQITHAWEDVKAMFNGGTRKRLLHSAASGTSHRSHNQQNTGGNTPAETEQSTTNAATKRLRKTNSNNEETPASNLASSNTSQQCQQSPSAASVSPLPQLPTFSPQFVVDYMFQTQHHQKTKTHGSCPPAFPFPNCPSLPSWLKSPSNELRSSAISLPFNSTHQYAVPSFLATSAFKPVHQQQQQTRNGIWLQNCGFPPAIGTSSSNVVSKAVVKNDPVEDEEDHDEAQSISIEDEDEIEVDIETTEDETPALPLKPLSREASIQQADDPDDQLRDSPHVRPRLRQCSCSSSNDSLYMSAPTKSEKENSSRATSTTSIEILNEDSCHPVKNIPQATTAAAFSWKEFAYQEQAKVVSLSKDDNCFPINKIANTASEMANQAKIFNNHNNEFWHVASLCLQSSTSTSYHRLNQPNKNN